MNILQSKNTRKTSKYSRYDVFSLNNQLIDKLFCSKPPSFTVFINVKDSLHQSDGTFLLIKIKKFLNKTKKKTLLSHVFKFLNRV